MSTISDTLTPEKVQLIGGLPIASVESLPPTFNMLIYGDPGAGKTVLAGSASEVEELSPVLFVDIEGGTLSLRERFPQCEVVRLRSWRDLDSLYRDLAKGSDYNTLVIDSLSEMQKFGMYHIMREAVQKDSDRDPDLPGIGEWGKNTEQMRKFIRYFRDLPMNVIFTALDMPVAQKNGKVKHYPSMSSKLAREVAGLLDIVTFLYIKERDEGGTTIQDRMLLTMATESHVAKDRTDRLPQVVQNPTMRMLYDMMTPS